MQSLRKQEILIEQSPVCDSVFHISGYDYLDQVEAFRNGWITVQDASSAMVGVIGAKDLLKNTPGLVILDVCSAPGGKAMHLADLAALHDAAGRGGLKSRIEARDLTDYKVSLIEENLARCGFSNVETRVWDAAVFDPYMEERADLVLADLPCSGLGIIGKKPDIKFRLKEEEIPALAALQREILAVTARYVRPGGTLIFSTCTVNKTENDRNADWILKHLPFKKKDITACLPKGLRTMMKEGWENQIQIFPGKAPCDGFFIAAFERI